MPSAKSLARSEECLPYKNASLTVDERVKDLVDRMTLEEKAGQLFRYVKYSFNAFKFNANHRVVSQTGSPSLCCL